MRQYILLKPLPGLKVGAIFEHRKWDKNFPDRGSIGEGCMILAWKEGMCQQGWAGETFIFPGQVSDFFSWFKLLKEDKPGKCACCGK